MENNDKLDIISVSSIVKWTYSIGAVGAMALEYASVILKAKIFDSIASGVTSLKFLFIPILFFTLTKFSKIFLNHAQSFFKSNINIKNFEENSKKLVPLKIWKSDLHKGQALYQTLINYIPTHLNSVLSVPVAILQIIFILSVFLFQVISTQFYWALLSFPIIIGLSYASKFVYSKEFSESISRLNLQR